MKNPWIDFAYSESMVHPIDLESVSHHNKTSKLEYQFLLHLAPEPWIGNLNGKLLVLYSNPGATSDNVKKIFQPLHDLVMKKTIDNLSQKNAAYPHFHFDPELVDTEGGKWFRNKYKWLIEATSLKAVASNLITCELAPYHSLKWKIPKFMPPTQEFTYQIIREAMDRDAVILLARTPKLWLKNIPELEKYPKVFRPNSINASVSPNNYPKGFAEVVSAIQ
jgi:hypothetical protein